MPVAVFLPEFPLAWAGADAWELSWVADGVSGGPVRAKPGETAVLGLPRGREAAVSCRAVFGDELTLPYGAVWPQWLFDDMMVRLTAAGGYAATLAAALYRAGYRACAFDLPRFALEAEERLADPWDVDPATLAVIVAERRFRSDHLNDREREVVVVTGLPGTLAPDSPWGSVVVPDDTGAAIVEVSLDRVRRWMGGGYELTVCVSSGEGPAWTLSGPEGLRSGSLSVNALPEPSRLETDASPP